MDVQTYRIVVGQADQETEAERQQLAADLEERLQVSGAGVTIRRESERPGETMAAGAVLTVEVAVQAGRKVLDALRSWLASQRTEVEVQTADGRRIRISAANAEEATMLFDRAKSL